MILGLVFVPSQEYELKVNLKYKQICSKEINAN